MRIRYRTSRLNSTPPMGDPNATDIPAAAAAERTSLFRAVEVLELGDKDKSCLYGDHLRYG